MQVHSCQLIACRARSSSTWNPWLATCWAVLRASLSQNRWLFEATLSSSAIQYYQGNRFRIQAEATGKAVWTSLDHTVTTARVSIPGPNCNAGPLQGKEGPSPAAHVMQFTTGKACFSQNFKLSVPDRDSYRACLQVSSAQVSACQWTCSSIRRAGLATYSLSSS